MGLKVRRLLLCKIIHRQKASRTQIRMQLFNALNFQFRHSTLARYWFDIQVSEFQTEPQVYYSHSIVAGGLDEMS